MSLQVCMPMYLVPRITYLLYVGHLSSIIGIALCLTLDQTARYTNHEVATLALYSLCHYPIVRVRYHSLPLVCVK